MLLKGKTAVVYGAGGSVGGAVARSFAREGATVFLAGRTRDSLEVVAAAIREAGGTADVGLVDALDGASVDRHVDQVVATTNRLDVSFNAIAVDHIQRRTTGGSDRGRGGGTGCGPGGNQSAQRPSRWPPDVRPGQRCDPHLYG